MVGDEGFVDDEFHHIVQFDIFDCSSDFRVHRITEVVKEETFEKYLQRITELRINTTTYVALHYQFAVYIRETFAYPTAEE